MADDNARHRRERVADMLRHTLMRVVATRPGKITAEMIADIGPTTHEACQAIHDLCERVCLSPTELEALELAEAKALEKAAKAQQKAADKALEDAKEQEKKNADAHAELQKIEAIRRRPPGGVGQ